MGYVRTDIFLSKPQNAVSENIAKNKGIFVAELVRRIIDKSTVGLRHSREITRVRLLEVTNEAAWI